MTEEHKEALGTVRDWVLYVRDGACVTCLSTRSEEWQHCGNEHQWGRVKYGLNDDIRYTVRQCHTCHQLTDRFSRLAAINYFQGLIQAFEVPNVYTEERKERIIDTYHRLNAMETMKNIVWTYALRGYKDAPQEVLDAITLYQGPNPKASKWDLTMKA